ncbi:M48 family metalloprotease [Sedimenticola sp.]|uniref:M48 family metallopeptidase n=1 Tax=Sedimenticola sp. TaxID=1940285 RepID=UPI003D14C971
MKKYSKHLSMLLCLLLCGQQIPVAEARVGSSDLPDISDSSATLLTREDELQIDREMMNQLLNSGALLNDPIISKYIQSLGQSIGSIAATSQNRFQFFVLKDPNVNAFAMPGGHIGINAGLILASQSESELAGVIAHEISHVTQHHIARSVEKANQMNLPLTAAVIAAILLGAGDPQIANAAFAASIGGATQMQLDFSRANEKEADFMGIQLLSSAGYNPQGMGSFFARLQDETRYYGAGVPEFLRTHPVTTSRIAEAEDRARQFHNPHRQDSIHYLLARARLRVLTASSMDNLERTAKTEKPHTALEEETHRYLHALIQQHQGRPDKARIALEKLLHDHPDRIAYIYSLAELESSQNNEQGAITLYRKGLRQYPGNPLLTLAMAKSQIALKRSAEARELLEQLIRKQPYAEAYQLKADLEAQDGNMAASHLARAEYYYLIHEPHSALDQLNSAKRLPNLPNYFALRIDARIKQITEEMELIRERSSL